MTCEKAGRTFIWVAAVLWLLVNYAPGLPQGFFPIDDESLISIPQIRSLLDWELVRAWFTPGAHADFYPFRDFTYWLDVHLFGGDASGGTALAFRLQNFFWMVVCAGFLAKLARSLGVRAWVATLGSLGWLLLPLHSETLMWPSARKDCLALGLGMACAAMFASYWKTRKHSRGVAALAAYILCLLSKATLTLLPFCLLPLWMDSKEGDRPVRRIGLVAAVIGIVSALGQSVLYAGVTDMRFHYTSDYRLGAAAAGLGRMFAAIAFPAVDVENWGNWLSLNQGYVFPGAMIFLALSALTIMALASASRRRSWLTWLLGFWALYVPVSGLVFPHRNFYSARYIEAPLLVLWLWAMVVISRASERSTSAARAMAWGWTLVLMLAIAGTFAEARHWVSPVSALESALSQNPDNPSLMHMVATELRNSKRWGRLDSSGLQRLSELEGGLERVCSDEAARQAMPNSHLCCTYWMSELRGELPGARYSEISAQVRERTSRALQIPNPSLMGALLNRFDLWHALQSGSWSWDPIRLQRLLRAYESMPSFNPRLRMERWALACLVDGPDSAALLIEPWRSSHLLDREAESRVLVAMISGRPELAAQLQQCRKVGASAPGRTSAFRHQ